MDKKNLIFLALLGFVMVKQSLFPELNAINIYSIYISGHHISFVTAATFPVFKHAVLSLLLFSKKSRTGMHTYKYREKSKRILPICTSSTQIVTSNDIIIIIIKKQKHTLTFGLRLYFFFSTYKIDLNYT